MATQHGRLGRAALFVAVWVSTALAAELPDFDRLLPADTFLYVSIRHYDTMVERLRATALGRLWSRPDMQPFVKRVKRELTGLLEKARHDTKIPVRNLLKLPQGQLALGMSMLPQEDDVRWIVLVDVGGELQQAKQTIEEMVGGAIEKGAHKKIEPFRQTDITTVRFPKPEPAADANSEPEGEAGADEEDTPPPARPGPVLETLCYCQTGQLLVLSNRPTGVKLVLANLTGTDQPALCTREDFRAVRHRLDGKQQQIIAFLDLARLVATVMPADDEDGKPGPLAPVLNRLGLEQFRGLGASLDFGTPAYEFRLKAFLSVRNQHKGLTRLLDFPPRRLAPEPFVPPEVGSYFTISWDMAQFYDELEAMLNEFSPALLKALKDRVGGDHDDAVDLRRDLVAPLGNRVSTYSVYARPLTLRSRKDVVVVALKDARAFQAGFERLLRRLQSDMERRQYMGHTIYTPDAKFGIAIVSSHLVIAPSVALVEDVIRRSGRKAPSLSELELYQTGQRQLPGQTSAVSFTNMERVAEYVHHLLRTNQIAETLGVLSGSRLADLITALDGSDLPQFDVVRPYFAAPSIGYLIQQEDGLLLVDTCLRTPGG